MLLVVTDEKSGVRYRERRRPVFSSENSAVLKRSHVCARENDEDGVDGWLSMRSEV